MKRLSHEEQAKAAKNLLDSLKGKSFFCEPKVSEPCRCVRGICETHGQSITECLDKP